MSARSLNPLSIPQFSVRVIEDFEVPALLGIPAVIDVLSTADYLSVRRLPADFNLAAAISMFYFFGHGRLHLYFKSARMAEKFAVITGKRFQPWLTRLGKMAHPRSAQRIRAHRSHVRYLSRTVHR
jgi:hypothetical protein